MAGFLSQRRDGEHLISGFSEAALVRSSPFGTIIEISEKQLFCSRARPKERKKRSILGVCEYFFATRTQLLGKRGSFSEVSYCFLRPSDKFSTLYLT